MTEPLGRALRRHRLLRGMKQSHLAELLGVDQTTVSRWERGVLAVAPAWRARVQALLAAPPDPAQDAALKRLVEQSTAKVHLICDRTHRLLAASGPRCAEWRLDTGSLAGRCLLVYASADILAAEDRLDRIGWRDGRVASLALDTAANHDPVVPIRPGRVLWERLVLADGSAGRLVTTIA